MVHSRCTRLLTSESLCQLMEQKIDINIPAPAVPLDMPIELLHSTMGTEYNSTIASLPTHCEETTTTNLYKATINNNILVILQMTVQPCRLWHMVHRHCAI